MRSTAARTPSGPKQLVKQLTMRFMVTSQDLVGSARPGRAATGTSASGSTTRRARRPARTSSRSGRRPRRASPRRARAAVRSGRPSTCQRIRSLRSAVAPTRPTATLSCAAAAGRARPRAGSRPSTGPGRRRGARPCSGRSSAGTSWASAMHVEDLAGPAQQVRAVEVAEGLEVARGSPAAAWRSRPAGRRASTWRSGRLARRASSLPPFRQPAGDLQPAAVQLVQARQPPPAVLVGAVLGSPSRKSANSASAQAIRPSASSSAVEHVGQRRAGGGRRRARSGAARGLSGPSPPVGPRLAAGERDAERLARPGCPARADSRSPTSPAAIWTSKTRAGTAPGLDLADPQVLARRVHDDLDRRVVHDVPERRRGRATASGSTTARRSRVATWIRQRTGSNVSSETNSVSNANRPAARRWATSSSSPAAVVIRGGSAGAWLIAIHPGGIRHPSPLRMISDYEARRGSQVPDSVRGRSPIREGEAPKPRWDFHSLGGRGSLANPGGWSPDRGRRANPCHPDKTAERSGSAGSSPSPGRDVVASGLSRRSRGGIRGSRRWPPSCSPAGRGGRHRGS